MAWVYLAEDINEGRLVAVKVLYPQFSEDLAYIQRFNREAKLASTLSDEHIVRVLDYGATRDVHYLVMEYIEGQDLRTIIDERGSLPWREALQVLDQVAVALEHAHLHGIVHRDIKPQRWCVKGFGLWHRARSYVTFVDPVWIRWIALLYFARTGYGRRRGYSV
jgi:serine/threonine-protein kinase